MDNVKKENYIESKCPNCGSDLKFLPGTLKTKCKSCGSEFDIESLGSGKLDEYENDFADTLAQLKSKAKVSIERVIHCEDCGGTITLNDKTISTQCPYCGSFKAVVENKENEIIKIAGVIPFTLSEDDVKTAFNKWIKTKFFAPRKFKNGRHQPSYSAFYIPFYTFDSDTTSPYTGYRGDYYYTTRTISTKNGTRTVTERHTRWTYRTGTIHRLFDDVLINGTNNTLRSFIEKIDTFEFSKMQVFQEKFLLGYYTERPSIDLSDGFKYAQQEMMNEIKKDIIKEIGGDTYRDIKFSTKYENVTFKQILAPIYNGHYMYNKKRYNFVCNGQTGQCYGKYPISAVKVGSIVFIILILIGLAIFLYFYLQS